MHEKSQAVSSYVFIPPTEIMVRKNNIEQDKNDKFYTYSDVSEAINTTINISSSFLLT